MKQYRDKDNEWTRDSGVPPSYRKLLELDRARFEEEVLSTYSTVNAEDVEADMRKAIDLLAARMNSFGNSMGEVMHRWNYLVQGGHVAKCPICRQRPDIVQSNNDFYYRIGLSCCRIAVHEIVSFPYAELSRTLIASWNLAVTMYGMTIDDALVYLQRGSFGEPVTLKDLLQS